MNGRTTLGSEDPRIARSRSGVLEAAAALIMERGPAAFTIDAIVERTGIARTTIYRHWPTRGDLLAAAIGTLSSPATIPDTGALRTDLLEFFVRRARAMQGDHWDRSLQSLPGIIDAARLDPALKAVVTAIPTGLQRSVVLMLERGRSRHELRIDRNLVAIADMLIGAVFFRRGFLGQPLTEQYLQEIIDYLLDGVAPTGARPKGSGSRPRGTELVEQCRGERSDGNR
jgi:AcrR family transcriptional regulator